MTTGDEEGDILIKTDEQYECPYCGAQGCNGDWIDCESWSRRVDCPSCGRFWTEAASIVEVWIPAEHAEAFKQAHPTGVFDGYNYLTACDTKVPAQAGG